MGNTLDEFKCFVVTEHIAELRLREHGPVQGVVEKSSSNSNFISPKLCKNNSSTSAACKRSFPARVVCMELVGSTGNAEGVYYKWLAKDGKLALQLFKQGVIRCLCGFTSTVLCRGRFDCRFGLNLGFQTLCKRGESRGCRGWPGEDVDILDRKLARKETRSTIDIFSRR
jgi:hypothetical protein